MAGGVSHRGPQSSGQKASSSRRLPGHNSSAVPACSSLCVPVSLGEADIWEGAAGSLCQQQPAPGSCCLAQRCRGSSSGLFRKACTQLQIWGLTLACGCLKHLAGEEQCQGGPWPLPGFGHRVAPHSGNLCFPKPFFFFSPLNSSAVLAITFVGVLLPSVS